MNETLLAMILGVAVGIVLSLLYLAWRIRMVLTSLDEYVESAVDRMADTFLRVIVERENDTYYCYNKADRQFVCQGTTVSELLDRFETACPGKTFMLAEGTDAVIIDEFRKLGQK